MDGKALSKLAGIGVFGLIETVHWLILFRQFTLLHHRHAVGHCRYQRQIMTDQPQRHTRLLLYIFQQRQYLGLNVYIQGRGGFIGN